MQVLKSLLLAGAIGLLSPHVRAGTVPDPCTAADTAKIVCRIKLTVSGKGTSASPCTVSMPPIPVGRNDPNEGTSTVLIFFFRGHKDLSFDPSAPVVFDKVVQNQTDPAQVFPFVALASPRAAIYLDTNPANETFNYYVQIKNVQTGNTCTSSDPLITNMN